MIDDGNDSSNAAARRHGTGTVLHQIVTVVGLTAVALAGGLALQGVLPRSSISLIFLIGVLLAAVAHGAWTGVAAAILASATFNFFFIPPVLTFRVADREEVFALGVFLLVGLLTGSVAGRMRAQADSARRRADILQSLSDYSARLAGADSMEAALETAGREIAQTLHVPVILLRPRAADQDAGLAVAGGWPEGASSLSPADWQGAEWARRSALVSPRSIDPDGEQRFEFHPVMLADRVAAVIGIRRPPLPDADEDQVIRGVVRQAAIALARLEHAQEASAARAVALEEQLRNAVLSALSHDLRTPLATILGSVTSLRELGPSLSEEDRADLLAAIEDEARRLSRFVGNLLDMTRVQAGALAARRDWVDVGDVVRSALGRARRVAPGVTFSAALPSGLPLIRADPTLLEQVLFNLLDNAAKYAGACGPVEIRAGREGDDLAIAVTDQGPGIPLEESGTVFERFRRLARGDGRVPGTGLGLAIARGMMTAMGGRVDLEWPQGGGCRFVVRLPVPAEEPVPP